MTSRIYVGKVPVDRIRFRQALGACAELRRGTVYTPNVDHVVLAEKEHRFAEVYRRCTLSLADGFPLIVYSYMIGLPLPDKVSGSDLFAPLMQEWAKRGRKVFFLGPSEEVAREATGRLRKAGLDVVGRNCMELPKTPEDGALAYLTKQVTRSKADAVVYSLGAPKQEVWAAVLSRTTKTLGVCLGASMGFYVGATPRAPKWMSRCGLEWAHRLANDPKRLGKRYLTGAVEFPRIAVGSLLKRTG